jgi:hypothetical protein
MHEFVHQYGLKNMVQNNLQNWGSSSTDSEGAGYAE